MTHKVSFSIPKRDLGKADVIFSVTRNGAKFGALAVSNGSLVWYPRSKKIGHKLNWVKFDQDAQKYPKIERR
jgi:hypothetical protein